MSYILDALRRADSERERGSVPGIHAQPVPLVSPAELMPHKVKSWMWIGGGVLASLLAVLAGYLAGREAPRDASESAVVEGAASAGPMGDRLAGDQGAGDRRAGDRPAGYAASSAAPATNPGPAAGSAATATSPAAPVAYAAPEVRRPAPTPAPPTRSAAPAPRPVARAPAQPEPAPGASVEPAAGARIYSPSELPEHIRRELPSVTIGGSIYSSNPANRYLIINGRTYHEKEQVTSELSLEEIKLKAAVLRYKGYLYELAY